MQTVFIDCKKPLISKLKQVCRPQKDKGKETFQTPFILSLGSKEFRIRYNVFHIFGAKFTWIPKRESIIIL